MFKHHVLVHKYAVVHGVSQTRYTILPLTVHIALDRLRKCLLHVQTSRRLFLARFSRQMEYAQDRNHYEE